MFRYLSIFFILLALVFWGVFRLMNRPQPLGLNLAKDLEQTRDLEQAPPLQLRQMELYEFQENQESLRIFAQEALIYEEQEKSFLFGVLAKIYEKNQANPTQVKAQKASLNGKTDMVILNGKVEVNWDQESLLQTDILFYDHQAERLFNRNKVWLRSRLDEVEGDSLSYDLKKGLLLIQNPILTLFEG